MEKLSLLDFKEDGKCVCILTLKQKLFFCILILSKTATFRTV